MRREGGDGRLAWRPANGWGEGVSENYPFHYRENTMLKFIGGTAGIIFIIGLIVVIGIFKLIF